MWTSPREQTSAVGVGGNEVRDTKTTPGKSGEAHVVGKVSEVHRTLPKPTQDDEDKHVVDGRNSPLLRSSSIEMKLQRTASSSSEGFAPKIALARLRGEESVQSLQGTSSAHQNVNSPVIAPHNFQSAPVLRQLRRDVSMVTLKADALETTQMLDELDHMLDEDGQSPENAANEATDDMQAEELVLRLLAAEVLGGFLQLAESFGPQPDPGMVLAFFDVDSPLHEVGCCGGGSMQNRGVVLL